MPSTSSHAGSSWGTQTSLSLRPSSSSIRSTPTARTSIRQPGKVGALTHTSASSASPCSPIVSVTNP